MRILVVEDERDLNRIICKRLAAGGYSTDACYDGLEALDYLESTDYDAAIFDVMMPRMDGFTAVRKLRERGDATPVLFLTARDAVGDRVEGLDLGANDYLVKPFSFDELLARVRSQLRRYTRLGGQAPEKPSILTIGGICLDDEAKSVTVDGEPANLTPMEFAILRLLMSNPGKVYSSRSLYEAVWNEACLLYTSPSPRD